MKVLTSPILTHLVNTGCEVDIYMISHVLSRYSTLKIFNVPEAILINHFQPNLCKVFKDECDHFLYTVLTKHISLCTISSYRWVDFFEARFVLIIQHGCCLFTANFETGVASSYCQNFL